MTLEAVLIIAQQLDRNDQLRLIAQLAQSIAQPAERVMLSDTDRDAAWHEFLALGDETAQLPPLATDSADVLSAMRR